jgi:hypothetical protein
MREIQAASTSGVLVNVDDNVGHVGFRGFSLSENATTAAAARVRLRQGTSTGDIVCTVRLAASGSSTVSHNEAVYVNGDLYYELASGTVEGCIYVD